MGSLGWNVTSSGWSLTLKTIASPSSSMEAAMGFAKRRRHASRRGKVVLIPGSEFAAASANDEFACCPGYSPSYSSCIAHGTRAHGRWRGEGGFLLLQVWVFLRRLASTTVRATRKTQDAHLLTLISLRYRSHGGSRVVSLALPKGLAGAACAFLSPHGGGAGARSERLARLQGALL